MSVPRKTEARQYTLRSDFSCRQLSLLVLMAFKRLSDNQIIAQHVTATLLLHK